LQSSFLETIQTNLPRLAEAADPGVQDDS
jgi:hypothetical protein